MNLHIAELQNAWLESEIKKLGNNKSDRKKRSYIHFDFRPAKIDRAFSKFVWMPDRIVGHSFYPFVKYPQVTRKHKEKNGHRFIHEKIRDIYYASHRDALIFSWYNFYLNYLYNNKLEEYDLNDSVIAYRGLNKSSVDFAKEVFDFAKNIGDCLILCFDIKGFFDNLDHKQIKVQWKNILGASDKSGLPNDHYTVFKATTKFSYIEMDDIKKEFDKFKGRFCSPKETKKKLSKTGKIKQNKNDFGIPQGSPISASISNIYMLDFDKNVKEYIDNKKGLYRRYCDDIILVIGHREGPGIQPDRRRGVTEPGVNPRGLVRARAGQAQRHEADRGKAAAQRMRVQRCVHRVAAHKPVQTGFGGTPSSSVSSSGPQQP